MLAVVLCCLLITNVVVNAGSHYAEEDDDDDEYDSEMDDFIEDDSKDTAEQATYNRELRDTLLDVYGYDRQRYRNERPFDDRSMEVRRWSEIDKEERQSARAALLEDAREERRGAQSLAW